jgi:UDP-glucose 4-epimerase
MDKHNYILVKGGAGYIGSHMTLGLLAERPLVVDDLSTGLRSAVPADVPFFQGDCGDAAFVAEILDRYQVEAIIHFAASIVVPDSVLSPLAYYENNTMKARALIECAVLHRISYFVFSSTAAVYSEPQSVPVVVQVGN